MIFRFVLGWLLKLLILVAGITVLSWPFFWPSAQERGIWRSQGYGMVVDIGRFGITGYQETSVSCLPFFGAPAHRLFLTEMADVTLSARDGQLIIEADGTANPILADRIDSLPPACQDGGTPAAPANPRETFDVAWAAMNENYPFFDLYGVDWRARHDLIEGVTSEDTLWAALTAALDGLDDGHTYLIDPNAGRAFSPATPEVWADDVVAFRDVPRRLNLTVVEGTGVEFTVLEGNIGYVFFRHMGTNPGLGTTEADLAQSAFQQVADALSNTRAIILDNRLNPGGSDTVSLTYASFFTATDRTAFRKETLSPTGYTEPYDAVVTGNPQALTAPIYLLNSGYTASAAEIFAMAMSEMPQVKIIGEPTAGNLSDIMDISLPNDWILGLSHQVYRDSSGTALEGIGVRPDIARPFDADAFARGEDPLLQEVIRLIDG